MKLLSPAAVRRCIIADRGMAIITADFNQVEFRLAAAFAGERSLIEAAKRGESPLKTVAFKVFGAQHTEDQYRYSKNLGYGWIFGGGADTLSKQTGITMGEAIALIRDFEKEFPALKAYKRRMTDLVLKQALSPPEYKAFKSLQSQLYHYRTDTWEGRTARARIQAEMKRLCRNRVGYALTPYGRRLPVDASKPYAIVNYLIQSTARDLMCEALLDVMADEELEPTVLLPVHDELLGQAPIEEAEYYAQRYGEVMSREFQGVPITASGKVYGKSWGHGYMKGK